MSTKFAGIGALLYMFVFVGMCIGWAMNIVKIAQWNDATGMLVVRIIGAIIFPLGGVLGWL